MRKRAWLRPVLFGGLAWVVSAEPGAAQVTDSVGVQILETLRLLDRPPAPDTATLPADSVVPSGPGRLAAVRPESAADSVAAALLALSAYDATRYRGTSADFDAGVRVLVLHGDSASRASLRRQGTEVTADSIITLDEPAGRVTARGHPVFTPAGGDPVESQVVVYDINEERGSALGARTQYRESSTWYVTGDLPSVTPGVVYGSETHFTSCDLEVPHYHFAADEIKIVAGRVLVARSVHVYFADVPVFWLPFMAQSLGTGRTSGLLTPSFSMNDIVRTSGGYRRRVSNVGFYWAMSDYSDATVALDWFSENFTSVTAQIRYAWLRQFLNGTVNVRRYWRDEGGTELAFDTNHSWRMDERTNLRLSARYSSSTDFVRRNSFDPREVTESINSAGGLDRRFDWGNTSISGNRNQYLSDDRVEMTLPSAQVNLSSITLFRAPSARASWYNNLTWSGGARAERRTVDRTPQPGETLSAAIADIENVSGGVRSSISLGNLSWSQSVNVDRASVFQVPLDRASSPQILGTTPSGRTLVAPAVEESAGTLGDITQTNRTWQSSLSYQQTLIGSTTLTPSLSLSGNARRSDTINVARDRFVSAPTRLSFGATLKSDMFGFFAGVWPFEAIRHKVTPALNFSYAPELSSTPLQARVFGRQAIQPRKEFTLSLNQTFEAKRRPAEGDTVQAPSRTATPAATEGGLSVAGPSRAPRPDIVTLLGLNTTAVQYDFVEADSLGGLLFGFLTTRINNRISSDFLRGLTISMSHDLFADTTIVLASGERRPERRFAPHLADLNFGFSLDSRSALFRGFGLFGGDEPAEEPEPPTPEEEVEDPFELGTARGNEASVIPRRESRAAGAAAVARGATRVGSWSTNFSYSLTRPRSGTGRTSQMLTASARLKPTALWDLSWNTSYDLERGSFNDHVIRLTRDIHDWEARFDFSQTATGNWAFRFEVALKANRDFKFDYKQHNVQANQPR